jgi:hypothetical protein
MTAAVAFPPSLPRAAAWGFFFLGWVMGSILDERGDEVWVLIAVEPNRELVHRAGDNHPAIVDHDSTFAGIN